MALGSQPGLWEESTVNRRECESHPVAVHTEVACYAQKQPLGLALTVFPPALALGLSPPVGLHNTHDATGHGKYLYPCWGLSC